jgi:RNA polymerase sigma-70 factor (ECF subfamily)
MQNEASLIKYAQKGDEDAFANLYHCYNQRIYRYVFSRVGDRANTEELTSQTFLAALEGLPNYRHNGKFSAWIFSIARNKVMDFFRLQKREGHSVDKQYIAVMVNPQYINNIVAKERADALAVLVSQLPPDRKELLRLRFVVGLTYKEIAEITDRGTAAVKKAIYRLLEDLKSSLEKDHE